MSLPSNTETRGGEGGGRVGGVGGDGRRQVNEIFPVHQMSVFKKAVCQTPEANFMVVQFRSGHYLESSQT
jgi:hypothetical protein